MVSLSGDPSFLTSVIVDAFDVLPQNIQEYLAKQLYIKHAHEGVYYDVLYRITGERELFLSVREVHMYIVENYPTTSVASVYSAINRGYELHSHLIVKKKNP